MRRYQITRITTNNGQFDLPSEAVPFSFRFDNSVKDEWDVLCYVPVPLVVDEEHPSQLWTSDSKNTAVPDNVSAGYAKAYDSAVRN